MFSDEAGLKRITIHGLRHSHVSLLISKMYDIFEVSKRVGHSLLRQHKVFTAIYLMMYKRALPMIWTSSGEEHNMSAKNNDNHNRYRSQTIAFRVSPEEDKQINIAVSLSGMTKQDYIT